jgi:hypothetical protein
MNTLRFMVEIPATHFTTNEEWEKMIKLKIAELFPISGSDRIYVTFESEIE